MAAGQNVSSGMSIGVPGEGPRQSRSSPESVLITGGGSGIEAALAMELAERGCSVLVSGRRHGSLEAVAQSWWRISTTPVLRTHPLAKGFVPIRDTGAIRTRVRDAGMPTQIRQTRAPMVRMVPLIKWERRNPSTIVG